MFAFVVVVINPCGLRAVVGVDKLFNVEDKEEAFDDDEEEDVEEDGDEECCLDDDDVDDKDEVDSFSLKFTLPY